MKDMGGEYKMTLRTLWDVNEVLNDIEGRAARDRGAWMVHRDDGATKKPTRAAIVSAVLLHLASLPRAKQEEMVRDGMARLNATLKAAPPAATEQARPIIGKGEGRSKSRGA